MDLYIPVCTSCTHPEGGGTSSHSPPSPAASSAVMWSSRSAGSSALPQKGHGASPAAPAEPPAATAAPAAACAALLGVAAAGSLAGTLVCSARAWCDRGRGCSPRRGPYCCGSGAGAAAAAWRRVCCEPAATPGGCRCCPDGVAFPWVVCRWEACPGITAASSPGAAERRCATGLTGCAVSPCS